MWDVFCVYLEKMKVDKDNAKQGCILLTYQCTAAFIFFLILFYSVNFAIIVVKTGDSFLVFVTFALTFLIDQVKQFGTLAVIYIVVVRRFGFLKENEREFVDPGDKELKFEMAIPRLQSCCLKTLEHQTMENLALLTIGFYSIFILFDLTMSQFLNVDAKMMGTIDFVFLTVFFIEIILKTFASNGGFLTDYFSLFDATIVILSWVLMINGITQKGLGVLRLIRVVVITIRSITGKKSRLRHQSKEKNPVESVLKIVKQLQELPLPNSIKKEAKNVAQIIEDNKLYELAMDN